MTILILGAGAQGTLYGVKLARAGHEVTFVARGRRATELRNQGAVVENALTGRREVVRAAVVVDELAPTMKADLCLVTVRREQIEDVLPSCAAALEIARFVFLVNHANGSEHLFAAIGRRRVVLGFPGAAGGVDDGVDIYAEVAEQATVIEASAPDVAMCFRDAGFRVEVLRDVDSWLKRHAVFVTAICGGLYEAGGNARRLSAEPALVRSVILAVREGWAALDKVGIAPSPFALRAMFCWVPLPFAVNYWSRLLGSPRGELYFGRHARHAPKEVAELAADVRALAPNSTMPNLRALYAAIDRAAS